MCQFTVKMDDCLLRGDSSHLVSVIHYEGLTSTTLTRLDQLVTKVTGLCRLYVDLVCCGLSLQDLCGSGVLWFTSAGSMWIWFQSSSSCVEVFTDPLGEQRRSADPHRPWTNCKSNLLPSKVIYNNQ